MIVAITFGVMILAVLGMAIGVLAGRKCLQGSCGGLGTIKGLECMVCPGPCEDQPTEQESPHDQVVGMAVSVEDGGDSAPRQQRELVVINE